MQNTITKQYKAPINGPYSWPELPADYHHNYYIYIEDNYFWQAFVQIIIGCYFGNDVTKYIE